MEPTHLSRREFDGAIERAYWRWELLKRGGTYRRQSDDLNALWAESFFDLAGHRLDKPGLRDFALKQNGGIIEPPLSSAGRRLYDQVLRSTGLRFVVHPSLHIPIEDMAAYPIFADTPGRQPIVVDRGLLRKLAMEAHRRRGELPDRRLHQAIKIGKVGPSGFQFKGERIHFDTLRRVLDVFDLHTAGLTLAGVARQLGMSLAAAKRAWARATTLIPDWQIERWEESAMATHILSCSACRPWSEGLGADPCPKMARMLEPRPRRRVGGRTVTEREYFIPGATSLDLLAARTDGSLPGRSTPYRSTR